MSECKLPFPSKVGLDSPEKGLCPSNILLTLRISIGYGQLETRQSASFVVMTQDIAFFLALVSEQTDIVPSDSS